MCYLISQPISFLGTFISKLMITPYRVFFRNIFLENVCLYQRYDGILWKRKSKRKQDTTIRNIWRIILIPTYLSSKLSASWWTTIPSRRHVDAIKTQKNFYIKTYQHEKEKNAIVAITIKRKRITDTYIPQKNDWKRKAPWKKKSRIENMYPIRIKPIYLLFEHSQRKKPISSFRAKKKKLLLVLLLYQMKCPIWVCT